MPQHSNFINEHLMNQQSSGCVRFASGLPAAVSKVSYLEHSATRVAGRLGES